MKTNQTLSHINNYFEKLSFLLKSLDRQAIDNAIQIIYQAYQADHQIFIIGNGGSASTASHFCCDLSKGLLGHKGDRKVKRAKVISLTDNIALMSAWSNDTCYEDVFIEQLKNLLNKEDVLIGISASGNSENIVRAIDYAKKNDAKTIGFLGFNGGRLKDLADCVILAPENHYGRVEDIHLILEHLISEIIAEKATEI